MKNLNKIYALVFMLIFTVGGCQVTDKKVNLPIVDPFALTEGINESDNSIGRIMTVSGMMKVVNLDNAVSFSASKTTNLKQGETVELYMTIDGSTFAGATVLGQLYTGSSTPYYYHLPFVYSMVASSYSKIGWASETNVGAGSNYWSGTYWTGGNLTSVTNPILGSHSTSIMTMTSGFSTLVNHQEGDYADLREDFSSYPDYSDQPLFTSIDWGRQDIPPNLSNQINYPNTIVGGNFTSLLGTQYYYNTPWTRNGKVKIHIGRLAVSGSATNGPIYLKFYYDMNLQASAIGGTYPTGGNYKFHGADYDTMSNKTFTYYTGHGARYKTVTLNVYEEPAGGDCDRTHPDWPDCDGIEPI